MICIGLAFCHSLREYAVSERNLSPLFIQAGVELVVLGLHIIRGDNM